jgi:toxin ParE1/3/4
MNRTRFSPAAQDDLSAIWDYTVHNWGVAQAERYILGIREACEALADGRRKGRNADNIRPGYRKLTVGSHVLFFRVTGGGEIDVVRILHQRMDVAGHFED